MAGRCSLIAAALLHHLFTTALAAQVSSGESRSTEASQVHAFAASSVQRADAALHTHSHEAASTVHLRRLRSSHGHRVNIFRAAAASTAHSRLREQQVPLFVPKMGLANVTEPTPFPPPPPVLHPWKDMQPLDTAVGNYIISGFITQPTVTPPPSQSSLDLAFACPALLTWPSEVTVSTPDPCGSMDSGSWNVTGQDALVNWQTSCFDTTSPGVGAPTVSPITTYTMPNGDLFGTSQEVHGLFKSIIELRDCGGAAIYTVEEKIYKQAGKPDADACKKYRSCDGVLFFQYFVKNQAGAMIAMTPYTTIFQDSFDITDTAGSLIAQVSRDGWDPPIKPACEDAKPRLWHIKYASSPPGPWGAATAQWPIAAMMTMLAARDDSRQPNGSVLWSNCEALKSTGWVVLAGFFFCCCVCIPMAIFLVCSAPMLRSLGEFESRLFPKRMGKPSNYSA